MRLSALLLDCHYDDYRGAVNIVQVVDGTLKKGHKITSCASGQHFEVLDLGVNMSLPLATNTLRAGQVGYMITNVRDVRSSRVGDTLHTKGDTVEPLSGFRAAKPMVFQGLFPINSDDFEKLRAAVSKLTLNDASVTSQPENSTALGAGFRCGFLGLLHADVFHQRLQEEFGAEIIATAPTVPYRIKHHGEEKFVDCTSPLVIPSGGFPSKGTIIEEPLVEATIICQPHVVGKVVELCMDRRGEQLEQNFLDDSRVILRYRLPLGEVAADFSDELKSRSSGYATFDYEDAGMSQSDIVRMDVLVNGTVVDARDARPSLQGATTRQRPRRALKRRASSSIIRGGHTGGARWQNNRSRNPLRHAQKRHRQVLRRRHLSQEEIIGETKGGQASHASHR